MKLPSKLVQQLEKALQSEGYFITISSLSGGKLYHWQRQFKFPKEDVLPSLDELKKLVLKGMN